MYYVFAGVSSTVAGICQMLVYRPTKANGNSAHRGEWELCQNGKHGVPVCLHRLKILF